MSERELIKILQYIVFHLPSKDTFKLLNWIRSYDIYLITAGMNFFFRKHL